MTDVNTKYIIAVPILQMIHLAVDRILPDSPKLSYTHTTYY